MRIGERPRGPGQHVALVYPGVMLGVLFLVPFGIMLAVSFYHRVEQGFYAPAFELTHYARFFTSFFADHLLFSLYIAALASALCVVVGFPFTYALTRLPRRAMIPILVLLLSVLSLSEVVVGFAWSVLLSKTAGLSNILVWLGLLAKAEAWSPGFGAVLLGLCYLAFPYVVLVLFPPTSRLDRELTEAARTLGASSLGTFFTVVIPILRPAIIAAFILGFVFTLGSYLTPQILGRPQHWTLSVLITDQAIYAANLPFAAAMAMFLTFVSLVLVGVTLALTRARRFAR